jgi:chitinase
MYDTGSAALITHLRGIYGADTQPQELPADKITHVLYAFADIAPDGEV